MRNYGGKNLIKGSVVNLRPVSRNDLALIRDWRNSSEIRDNSFQYFLLNMEDQKKWFDRITKPDSSRSMFVIVDKKMHPVGVCGLIDLDFKNKSGEIAIMMDEKNRKKNFGSESLKLLIKYGFEKLKLHRIVAEVFEFNVASIRLFEKLHFRHEATYMDKLWQNHRWYNTRGYSIIADDYSP
jgi:UDP-4-amino-4,6-dideoxy-N-acetyl-beta-L-altrosamine N-acetyltransferase